MRSTLFYIPEKLAGLPLFGLGWLLGAWIVIGLIVVGWTMFRKDRDAPGVLAYLPLWGIVAGLIVFLLPGMLQDIPNSELRGLPIRGFGVMLLLATVGGVGLAVHRARQVNVDPDAIISLAFWMFAFGILGARLFYIVQYWSQFQKPTFGETLKALANVTEGGLVVYGSVIGGLAAGLIYLWKKKLPPLAIADIIAPSMVVGLALGRVGCFLNGCCYGGFCETAPPGLTFPAGSPPYLRQEQLGWRSGVWLTTVRGDEKKTMQRPAETPTESDPPTPTTDTPPRLRVAWVSPDSGPANASIKADDEVKAINGKQPTSLAEAQQLLAASSGVYELTMSDGRIIRWRSQHEPSRSAPVHPAQLYAAIDAGLLAWVLWNVFPYRRRDGEVFALLLTIHPVSRFLLEAIRSDEPGQFGTGLTISQWLSIAFLFVAAALWWYIERQPRGSVLPLPSSDAEPAKA